MWVQAGRNSMRALPEVTNAFPINVRSGLRPDDALIDSMPSPLDEKSNSTGVDRPNMVTDTRSLLFS